MGIFENDLNFKRNDVINSILLLSDNEHRLIHPRSIGPQDRKVAIDSKIYREYKLSERGKFYIENLIDWQEYINRVGPIKNAYDDIIQARNSL